MTKLTETEQKTLLLFKQQLLEFFKGQVDTIQLFGSKARGDVAKHSDVDIIVILKDMDWRDKRTIRGIAADIIFDTGVVLSVQVFSRRQVQEMKQRRAVFWQTIAPDLKAI